MDTSHLGSYILWDYFHHIASQITKNRKRECGETVDHLRSQLDVECITSVFILLVRLSNLTMLNCRE